MYSELRVIWSYAMIRLRIHGIKRRWKKVEQVNQEAETNLSDKMYFCNDFNVTSVDPMLFHT